MLRRAETNQKLWVGAAIEYQKAKSKGQMVRRDKRGGLEEVEEWREIIRDRERREPLTVAANTVWGHKVDN